MYSIVVCDDEPKMLKDLLEAIKNIFSELSVEAEYYSTYSSIELLEHLKKEKADILFLDIDMPEYNGMQIAEYMLEHASKVLLIFVTNHDELVYESFQYQPFGFIRKSYFSKEVQQVIYRSIKVLAERQDTMIIRSNSDIIKIQLCDIVYFEADSNYVNVFMTNNTYRYRESLGVLESKLAVKGFIRIHKGFLVNQQFVHAIRYDEIELSDGRLLPIGRTNRENVRKKIMQYMR